MRITIDINEDLLDKITEITGISKKSPAIVAALESYARSVRKRSLIDRVMEGGIDYGTTNDELESRSIYDAGKDLDA